MQRKAYHINEVQKLLDSAQRTGLAVSLQAWCTGGSAITYDGWLVRGGSWRGGFHRLVNPTNGEVRTVPDIFIFKFLGLPVYL